MARKLGHVFVCLVLLTVAMDRVKSQNTTELPMSCELRHLALKYAQDILQDRAGAESVAAALALSECPHFHHKQLHHENKHRRTSKSGARSHSTRRSENVLEDNSVEFFVATDGNDNNSGTMASPFRSLQRAQEAVRALPPPPKRPQVSVWFRQGTYFFGQPAVFGAADSGSSGKRTDIGIQNGSVKLVL